MVSNFSKYYGEGNEKINNNIPEQFKENNYQNYQNNNMNIIPNNNFNYNQNNNLNINNIGSNNNISNNNNNISGEESKNNSEFPPSIGIETNLQNPVFNIINQSQSDVNSDINTFNIINPQFNNIQEEEQNNILTQSKFIKEAVDSLTKGPENNGSNPEISQNEQSNNKINIVFILMDKKQRFDLTVNLNDIFLDILSNFLRENEINNNYYLAIHNYNVVNKEKTMRELNIKNGDEISLYSNSMKKKNSHLEEDDLEILNSFMDEYRAEKLNQYQKELNKAIREKRTLPRFNSKINHEELIQFLFKRAKDYTSGIKIREHDHDLVCCLTNFSWKCNLCKKNYDCQEEKFCCSLCDFNMCQACRKLKNYERRKAIKKDITPYNEKYRNKYLVSSLHEHKLIYCITSRNYFGETFWNCDICGKKGNYWAFYCTLCDFDLCADCFKKHEKK